MRGGGAGEGALLRESRPGPRQTEQGHSYGTTPLLPSALPRSAGRYRHPYLDSGAVLRCYGNPVGSLAGGRRQRLRGIQHWKQQLCPFAVVVLAFLNDEDTFPLPSQEAKGKPWDLRAVTPGSFYSCLCMRTQAPLWRGSLLGTLPWSVSFDHKFPWAFPLHFPC